MFFSSNFGVSVRRLSKTAGVPLEFNWPMLSVFCAAFTHFCSVFFLTKPVLPNDFPDILHTFPCSLDYQIKIIDGNGTQFSSAIHLYKKKRP